MTDKLGKYTISNGLVEEPILAATAIEAIGYVDRLSSLVAVTIEGPEGLITVDALRLLAAREGEERRKDRKSGGPKKEV